MRNTFSRTPRRRASIAARFVQLWREYVAETAADDAPTLSEISGLIAAAQSMRR